MKSAVLLIIFNRPDLTAQVLDILRRVRPPRLYVAADGSRPDRGEEDLCEAARANATAVDWPCEVFTHFSEENMGAGRRPSSAITWFFEHETDGIILEDDCMADDTFFPFCEELLDRYRDDNRVMMISGYYGPAESVGVETSYLFTKYPLTWGWATWRRAWAPYDLNITSKPAWKAFKESGKLSRICPDPAEHDYWIRQTEGALTEYSAWDYQWLITCWMHDGVCIVPAHNLVQNVGFRPDATHITDDILGRYATKVRPMEWPLRHPQTIVPNETYDGKTWVAMYRPISLLKRVQRKLIRTKVALLG